MKPGFVPDSLGGMSLADLLDHAARMGVSGVEVKTCGWSMAPHFDLAGMFNSLEGLEKSVELLKGVMPVRPGDYRLQAI
ncbi:MAG: hypothetical protein R3C70_15390 [Geminicoccaceae bacterium]